MENTGGVLFENDKAEWYVALGDRWIGPMAAADVYRKLQEQEISWAHFVWRQDQGDWKRVCDVETFQSYVPGKPPSDKPPSGKPPSAQAAKPVVKQAARPPAAARPWFLYYNESQFGPFSKDEIEHFLKVGKIHGRVHIWKDGMSGWERLEKIEEFSAAVAESRKILAERVGKKAADAAEHTRVAPVAGKQAGKADGKPESKSDKRSGPRVPMVAKILLANDEAVITAICRDISVGGMQVLTDRIPGGVGSRIKLNVSPTGGSKTFEPFATEGEIVRILEDGRGFSFRFGKISDAAKRSIESYLES